MEREGAALRINKGKGLRYWLNLLLFALAVSTAGAGITLAGLGYRAAVNYVHPVRAERAADDTPARYGIAYQDLELQTGDGIILKAWYTPSANGVIILSAHGYKGHRMADVHAFFARNGYGVISWDARASGESGGDLCTLGYFEKADVQAALDFALRQEGVRHVGGYGQSMGAATILQAAADMPGIEAVVADSSFVSAEQMLKSVIDYPVLRPAIRFFAEREAGVALREIRPVAVIARISPRPVLIIQGEQDTYVPAESAPQLYAAAGEPRSIWTGPRMGHVMMFERMAVEYQRRVIGFYDAYFIEQD